MLAHLHLCPTHRWRVRRYRRLHFDPGLNLLIGPNGSGKSTLLRAIAHCPDCQRQEQGATEYLYVDAEGMNPRHAHRAVRSSTDMVLQLRSAFSSHGEILQAAFSTLRMTPATCLLIDEPEAGQDFEHVLALRAAMERAAARGVQIIVATHQVLFWKGARVIELRRGYRRRITEALCRIHCAGTPAQG